MVSCYHLKYKGGAKIADVIIFENEKVHAHFLEDDLIMIFDNMEHFNKINAGDKVELIYIWTK